MTIGVRSQSCTREPTRDIVARVAKVLPATSTGQPFESLVVRLLVAVLQVSRDLLRSSASESLGKFPYFISIHHAAIGFKISNRVESRRGCMLPMTREMHYAHVLSELRARSILAFVISMLGVVYVLTSVDKYSWCKLSHLTLCSCNRVFLRRSTPLAFFW